MELCVFHAYVLDVCLSSGRDRSSALKLGVPRILF